MSTSFHHSIVRCSVVLSLVVLVCAGNAGATSRSDPVFQNNIESSPSVSSQLDGLAVGDLVFIRVAAKPFREVAAATGSWTNHVGVVVSVEGNEPLIGESTFPFSRATPLSRFVARSEGGRIAVARLNTPLTSTQQAQVAEAAKRRYGVFYDTGFDLHSRRQFCSRFAREVLLEATGVPVGEVETFQTLLARRPDTHLGFWKLWYFGQIPWSRETVTPASLLRSENLQIVFDGAVTEPFRSPVVR